MSTIKADNIATLAGVSTSMANAVNGSAKAWVNFNGTGTVAIRRAFNVSSITDGGTGDYTVNFTTAFADTSYSAIGSSGTDVPAGLLEVSSGKTVSGQRVISKNATNNTTADQSLISVAIFS